jgi:putative membrane protein insertion efficiency factor
MKSVASAVRRAAGATIGRAVQLVLIGLIRGYRAVLSPLLGPRCRYYPSCSAYGLEAVQVHGATKGSVLAVYRICRCNPWTAGGVDHVPPKGSWTSAPYVSLEDHGATPGPAAEPGTTDPDRPTSDRSAA